MLFVTDDSCVQTGQSPCIHCRDCIGLVVCRTSRLLCAMHLSSPDRTALAFHFTVVVVVFRTPSMSVMFDENNKID
jgi:hypothetical protein